MLRYRLQRFCNVAMQIEFTLQSTKFSFVGERESPGCSFYPNGRLSDFCQLVFTRRRTQLLQLTSQEGNRLRQFHDCATHALVKEMLDDPQAANT